MINTKKKNFSLKFKKVFDEIINDINFKKKKTISILSKDYKFNFKIKIEKFKKFKTIALIGMGGSILGAEAVNNFLRKKIKKIYFFNDLNENTISNFKKRKYLKCSLFNNFKIR